jgi:hypothetical protein
LSTHSVNIIEIKEVKPHEGAERLEIVPVGGWQAVVKKGQFKPGDLAIYIQPDYTVPVELPEFSFLAKGGKSRHRLKAVRLRGVLSFGLLIPVPANLLGFPAGTDVMKLLGIERYEPPVVMAGADELPADQCPSVYASKFDLESLANFPGVIVDGEPVLVSEKIHGCLQGHTKISMADGSRRRINSIKIDDEVLGVDEYGKVAPTRVTNTFRNGLTSDWLRITGNRLNAGRGSSFFSLAATSNHQFWSPERKTYVQAGHLCVGDKITMLRSELYGLSPIQEQVLLGKMLGDGSMQDGVTSAAIHWSHRKQDEAYAEWTARAIGSLDSGARETLTSGYGSDMIRMRTIGSVWIKDRFASFFSAADCSKKVPEWVAECLTPISVAFWYMDDGSLSASDGQEDRASFACCAFDVDSCAILQRGLRRIGIDSRLSEWGGYNRITLNTENAERLFLLVAPYVPPGMQRKLPERYRGHDGWLPKCDVEYRPMTVDQIIEAIEPCDKSQNRQRHDIETETHNFFANGVLVHNSNARYLFDGGTFFMGSRTRWLKPDVAHHWKRAADADSRIEAWCRAHPGVVLYGEVYGAVQSLKYGQKPGKVAFAAFAASDKGEWLDTLTLIDDGSLPTVPILYRGPYSADVLALAELDSVVPGAEAGHMREGIVIVPERERRDDRVGRVALKHISARYWEGND